MAIHKSLASSSLADVIEHVGVDAFVRVCIAGIELISIGARAVIASVESCLRYAEAGGLTTDQVAAAA